MTRPGSRPVHSAAAMSGAVDLSALKAKAEAPAAPAGAADSAVVEVTEANFQAEIVDRSMHTLMIVDLWASWCEPCKQLSPVLERLAAASGGAWVLAKVDVDAHPRIAELFEVKSLPTVVAIAGGQPVQAFAGAQPEAQIKQWIEGLLTALKDQLPGPGPGAVGDPPAPGSEQAAADPRFDAAEQAVQAGDFDSAIQAYQQILDAEPSNTEAAAAQVQVRFMVRLQSLPADVIARADAAPGDTEAQLGAADAEIAGQQVEAAFTRLVTTLRRSSAEDKDRVRSRLLSLFELFEPGDPMVVAARRKLAAALY